MSSATMPEPPAQDAVKLDENPLKRKSAPESEPESPKRTRTDRDGARDGAIAEHRAEPPKRPLDEARARVAQEEKRRGMRLFGGLMGTLNQRPTNPAQQQKRLEIEKRQQERLRQQREVEERALQEKRAARDEVRGRESIKWEEQVLHVRHSTLRAQAGSLRTEARPAIFYKPWILTADQKDQIKRQRRDADETIEREVEEFRMRKEEHARKYGLEIQAEEKQDSTEPADVEKPQEPATEPEKVPVPEERRNSRSGADHEHHDDTNDVVVESGEDVVIY